LYLPAIYNGFFGGYITGENIVNPNSTPVTVTLTYYTASNGTAIPTAPFVIGSHSLVSIYQGATSGTGVPSGGQLTNFNGAVTITATNGVVAVVNEGIPGGGSGVYSAVSSGGSKVYIPVMANGGFGFTTGATILNTSNQTVNGTLQYYNLDTSTAGTVQSFTIAPNASQQYYQGSAGLSAGYYGVAVVTVTGGPANSLIVTTNAISSNFFYTYTEPNGSNSPVVPSIEIR
jgi:hypothetical protein